MVILDFSKEEGKAKGTALAKEIFADFDKVETAFTEYGSMEIFVDDCFEFSFRSDDLLQAKRLVRLLELKKLDRLTNCKCGECDE